MARDNNPQGTVGNTSDDRFDEVADSFLDGVLAEPPQEANGVDDAGKTRAPERENAEDDQDAPEGDDDPEAAEDEGQAEDEEEDQPRDDKGRFASDDAK